MPRHTTMRRFSDTVRSPRGRFAAGRWLAAALVLAAAAAGAFMLNRDVDWETRNREARALGRTAETNGNHAAARRFYETALANHPYDWETHLALARLLQRFLGDNENALRHYLYALAYGPAAASTPETRREIAVLRLIRSGELEDPRNALEDMFLAVETGSRDVFGQRLAPALRDDFEDYWRGWSRRGRGRVAFCRVTGGRAGTYDAMVELDFPDESSASMHLAGGLRSVWRLELAFP